MRHGHGKSDRPRVSGKPPNKAADPAAEAGESRGLAKGNSLQRTPPRPQRRAGGSHALERVRQVAKRDRPQRVPALRHPGSALERLQAASEGVNPRASAGVDGEPWAHYGRTREANLRDLAGRRKRGASRAQPVRRAFLPKADGRQRPRGVPALEDKLVQRAGVEVLDASSATDSLGFASGFRPGRSPQDALDALSTGLRTQQGNGGLDADSRSFFDPLQPGWRGKFLEHRGADRRLVRRIQKGRSAGVRAEEERTWREAPGRAGAAVRAWPLSTLHSGFDLGVHRWRQTPATGDGVGGRFADDCVGGFQYRPEAERFFAALRERCAQVGLALHPDKTRLLEVGPCADRNRRGRGPGQPETFHCLGFTHSWGKPRSGMVTVRRPTVRRRWLAKRHEGKAELRRRRPLPIPEPGA